MNGFYDGIILGTGHNALILQAYLARSGLKVLSLDRASVPGVAWPQWRTQPAWLLPQHPFLLPPR